jgi:PiT family inorganic phosphate transporter
MHVSLTVLLVIVTALAFDFTNGFHDTANAMATSIATGALRPKVAVLISGVLNLVGAFVSTKVARTISSGIVDDRSVTPAIVFAGLVGAILWNLATWFLGLPSSSSHALFGGLIGAVWVGAGEHAVHFDQVLGKVLIPALASPLIAGAAATIATFAAYRITHRVAAGRAADRFRHGQTVSASLVSLAHGTNDAQKTMGVITLTLISTGALASGSGPPVWVILAAGLSMGLGTYVGGWRIIRTMGNRITEVAPTQGFAAESAATTVILSSANLGFALSTTHVVAGSVLGSGLGRRLAQVHWSVAGQMALAWLLTLPAAATVGALAAEVAERGTPGLVLIGAVAVAAAAAIWVASRREAVNAANVNHIDEPRLHAPSPRATAVA